MIKHAAQKSFFGSLHQLAFAATVYHLCVGEQPNIGHGAQGHAWIIAGWKNILKRSRRYSASNGSEFSYFVLSGVKFPWVDWVSWFFWYSISQ